MDPRVFSPDAVDPETRLLIERIEAFAAERPHPAETTPEAARQAREEGRSVFGPIRLSARATSRTIPGPAGEMPVRMFLADEPAGVYLHFHGGGWVVGDVHHQDAILEQIADRCSLTVFSVGYRLAPEHPYPAGPDDCEAAACWLVECAREALGTDVLTIGGDSAGAHLAAVTLIRMRDRHEFTGFRAANLVYGIYDLRMTPSARSWGERPLILDTRSMTSYRGHFLPEAQLAEDPDVSPILADLQDLPPALFTVGTADRLLDDTLFMYSRWVAAGNSAGLALYPGAPHAFDRFDVPVAEAALTRAAGFLSAATATSP